MLSYFSSNTKNWSFNANEFLHILGFPGTLGIIITALGYLNIANHSETSSLRCIFTDFCGTGVLSLEKPHHVSFSAWNGGFERPEDFFDTHSINLWFRGSNWQFLMVSPERIGNSGSTPEHKYQWGGSNSSIWFQFLNKTTYELFSMASSTLKPLFSAFRGALTLYRTNISSLFLEDRNRNWISRFSSAHNHTDLLWKKYR